MMFMVHHKNFQIFRRVVTYCFNVFVIQDDIKQGSYTMQLNDVYYHPISITITFHQNVNFKSKFFSVRSVFLEFKLY